MIETEEQRQIIHALYLQEYPKLLAYARSLLHDESLAKEAVQDTFLIACTKPAVLLSHPNPPGWLMQTLKYTIHNMNRGRAKLSALLLYYQEVPLAEDPLPLGELELDITCEDLLGKEDWLMLKNFLLHHMSVQDVADSMGISREAAKKRLQRSHKRLKEKLKRD